MVTNSRAGFRWLRPVLLICLLLPGVVGPLAADTVTNSAADTNISNEDSLRSYLQIQEQLHNTVLAIEKNREEAAALAASNSLVLESRLKGMEIALASQRLDELKDIERSDRVILIAVAFALVGFVVLLIAASLQWLAVNRLAAATARLPSIESLERLGVGQGQMLPAQALEQSTTRFLGVIERLEQRIHDMERAAQSRPTLSEGQPAAAGAKAPNEASQNDATTAPAAVGNTPAALLLNKGQTLLKLDKPEAALECLEELLTLDPANTDALLKKGAALERLQRLPEAIECYDRVIAQDNTLTMAYLYKGAVFNRMERYSEALECYEQALKTRQKSHAANVIFE